ncbi:MAG: flagellar basal body P-ring protein FlgI [Phycisphaeraceae bacterium]|nr:MAG: flagellar basal body P-ring protein FlgI [Phycisphaeraceae bacterium]
MLLAFGLGALSACSGVEKAPPQPRSANTKATIPLDVPEIMKGTVASLGVLDGHEDIVVHGWGFVVGLRGTGSRIMPDPVRAHMLAEMARMGVGQVSMGSSLSPEALLDSPDTAVVIVEGIIPGGSPQGTRFDVRVSIPPGTDATSLEGGRLWTTDLRPMLNPGPPPVGSRQARAIAKASGDIFTNPFVTPGGDETAELATGTNVNRMSGHILGGGATSRDLPLKLRIASPSHTTASTLQQVINSYFPQEPGQRSKTARGEGDASIEITVPPSYYGRVSEFTYLLQHTTLLTGATPYAVQFINRELKRAPGEFEHATWRWQALGVQVLPGIREFYTYPEEKPRYAALRAGARLNDAHVEPHLLDLAKTGSPVVRKDAIRLLGDMSPQPGTIFALRELLDDADPDVRIAAYEALAKANTRFIRTIQVDRKFMVDYVESARPMIYVTLLEFPRIVVFGLNNEISRPITLQTWGSRFIIRGGADSDLIDVLYRDEEGNASPHRISPRLTEFIPFLGHTTTIERPMPGLGLTYTETIGILHAIHAAQHLPGVQFRTEQDRILLAIQERMAERRDYQERPEFIEFEELPPAPSPTPGDQGGSAIDGGGVLAPIRRDQGPASGGSDAPPGR